MWFLEDITKEDIIHLAVSIYKEIAKRKQQGKMNYTISQKKSGSYSLLWEEVKQYLSPDEIEILEEKSRVKKGYYSKAKPYYRFFIEEIDEELENIKWNKEKLLVDLKADGLRVSFGKASNEPFIFVDPEDVKLKTPDVTKRLEIIAKDIEENIPPNTVLDGELIVLNKDRTEILHRTVTNSYLNAKIPTKELEIIPAIFTFDCLFFNGEDIRSYPLHERLEYLQRIKETDHILIERVSNNIKQEADAYIIDSKDIKTVFEKIVEDKIGRPKFVAEGVMIKLLNHSYEYPTNHGWGKMKEWYEIDLRVIEKNLVKDTNDVYNYVVGYDIDRDEAFTILEKSTKDWYGKVALIMKDKTVKIGREIKEDDDGIFCIIAGKTDNAKEIDKIEIGDIIRIAAEEVMHYEEDDVERFSFYIGRFLQKVPEKNVTDKKEVLRKLASFQPKRIPLEELRHWRKKLKMCPTCKALILDEVCTECFCAKNELLTKENIAKWIKQGYIDEDAYEKLAKPNEPLDKLYNHNEFGRFAWLQMHFRGIDPDDRKKYEEGKISLAKLIEGHSIHLDLRMKSSEGLIQWVITQDDVKDYLETLLGERDEKTGNVSKGLAIVKPSAEEPSGEKAKELKEPIIGPDDAKILAKYILMDYSYFIDAGDIGATVYKDALMATVWLGQVDFGVQRQDCHEYFFKPSENIPKRNKELLNGRYIVRCFKAGNDRRWWFWKACDDPFPMDPIEHSDIGALFPVKEDKVERFGHDEYVKQSKQLFKEKFNI